MRPRREPICSRNCPIGRWSTSSSTGVKKSDPRDCLVEGGSRGPKNWKGRPRFHATCIANRRKTMTEGVGAP